MAGGLRLRCPDATLAGWLGWLAGLAGWLQLAGCCWLAAAGWLTEIRKLAWKVVSHARRSREVGGFIFMETFIVILDLSLTTMYVD